jgi:CTP synthase (UTP-ammonia lyase)
MCWQDEGCEPDVCVIELGGTVGDIESMPFIEALRQLQYKIGMDNMFIVQVPMRAMLTHLSAAAAPARARFCFELTTVSCAAGHPGADHV